MGIGLAVPLESGAHRTSPYQVSQPGHKSHQIRVHLAHTVTDRIGSEHIGLCVGRHYINGPII